MANLRPLPPNRRRIARHTKESRSFQRLCSSRAQTCRTRTLGFKVTALEPPADPNPALRSGVQRGRQGQPLCKGLTFSDAFVNAWAERSCSQVCSRAADSADVRACSLVSKSLVALRIRSLANCCEHAAGDWGLEGHRSPKCPVVVGCGRVSVGNAHVSCRWKGRFRWSRACRSWSVNPSRKLRRFESFTCHHVLKGPLTCGNAGREPFHIPGWGLSNTVVSRS